MRFKRVEQWLAWQETLHPKNIELGLDRVRPVYQQLLPRGLSASIISVAGTNGKGSVVAMLEAILLDAGYKVGSYTSPHLLHYNERIRVNGEMINDAELCACFEQVDQARGETTLTYFEFGSLAAFNYFSKQPLDIILLEVGLGGRLDVVNIIDPDVAVITSIDLDHQEWLGDTRESVAMEKMGIARTGKPLVLGDLNPPSNALTIAKDKQVELYLIKKDFHYAIMNQQWSWWNGLQKYYALPFPAMRGNHQFQNASTVLQALSCIGAKHPISANNIRVGLQQTQLPGRWQRINKDREYFLDVAHNPAATRELAKNLKLNTHFGKTIAIIAVLQEKDLAAMVEPLKKEVTEWFVVQLQCPRARDAQETSRAIQSILRLEVKPRCFNDMKTAIDTTRHHSQITDRIVIFGSFYTVAAALAIL
ncbi:MAG: bifunctional tetrahydrofolate synthase/dihydrofolate synthase [Gammaproteobacteria bacterium]|nr:bifunctional tetrahydrofolate synthase/dihydrofolate synthase [Gammaproteobacteria bacterium]MDH5729016.1 bifunctional tetrahydrofolate synthase/dihydrofolate synthase [Gammaproteobacteria bacterium]